MKSVKVNSVLNIIKQLCSVVFPLITIPYVTRILSTESYGLVSYAYSIISYFMLFAALGASTYAIREGAGIRNNQEKINKFSSEIFTITLVSTIVSFIVLIILVFTVDSFQNIKSLLLLFSTTFILTTLGTDWVNSIFEDFTYITIRYIVFQLIALILIFILVKNSDDYFWYAFTMVVATVGANILNIFYVRRYVHIKPTLKVNCNKHLKPIMILFCNSIAGTVYINSDITILGIMTNDYNVGIYSMASKIYMVIKQLLNALVAAVLPRASSYLGIGDKEKYKNLSQELFDVLFILIPPAAIGMISLSKEIIEIIASNKYLEGATAFIILSIAIIFAAFANYFASIILIPHKQDKTCLYGSIISAIINIVLNIILIPRWGYNAAALTTLISELFICVYYFINAYKLCEISFNIKHIISVIIGCILMAIVIKMIKVFIAQLFIKLVLSVIIGVLTYFLILLILKNKLVINYLNIVVKKLKK